MALATTNAGSAQPNHPLAVRMGVIAGVSHNVLIGTIMGSFSLLLGPTQQRLGISEGQAAAGIPLVLVGSSILAPFVGVLIAKFSLRLLLLAGALLMVAGYATLALTHSYAFYLIAYGLFLGPAMTLSGSIGPATLVTRWFGRNRGLALGVVHLPILIAILPKALNWFLDGHSAIAAYTIMALLAAVLLVPLTLMVIDHPPGREPVAAAPAEKRTADGSLSVLQLLSLPRFWALCVAAIASMTSSVLLGSLIIPMAISWDFTLDQAASIQSIMSLVGILGSVLFGWVSDRLGGGRSLALIGFDCAVLWAILLLHPPFLLTALVIGLIGMHGAGAIPALGRGISDAFGAASYSRGWGLNSTISLPFMAAAIIGSARLHTVSGSYDGAIITMVCFFGTAVLLGLYGAAGAKAKTSPA